MSESNLPPFYVGQRVVALNDDINARFKKGDVKKVLSIQKGCCEWEIDIGEKHNSWMSHCVICGQFEKPKDNIGWYRASKFAPVEETFESISYSKVMEKESPLISAN